MRSMKQKCILQKLMNKHIGLDQKSMIQTVKFELISFVIYL